MLSDVIDYKYQNRNNSSTVVNFFLNMLLTHNSFSYG